MGRSLWRKFGSILCQNKLAAISHLSARTICILQVMKSMYIQHIQGLCQFKLSTADHALLSVAPATTAVSSLERSYDWPPPSLGILCFLYRGSPYPMLWTFAFFDFSWLRTCKSRTGVRLGKFLVVRRTSFCRRCTFSRWLSATKSQAGQAWYY
jgi:hypothetical protein